MRRCLHLIEADELPRPGKDADIMQLNVWLKSTIERNPVFNPQTKKWTVRVKREGQDDRVLEVSHIVLATGFSGEPRKPKFPIDEFKGIVHHSAVHPGARGQGWKGKKAVGTSCDLARSRSPAPADAPPHLQSLVAATVGESLPLSLFLVSD